MNFSIMSEYCNFANNLSNFQHYFSLAVETEQGTKPSRQENNSLNHVIHTEL